MTLRPRHSAVLALSCLVAAACGPGGPAALPSTLGPLDETNLAPLPTAEDGLEHPEKANTTTGDEGDHKWAHLRGYVRRPIASVWAALRDPEVTVDRRRVHEYSFERDIDPAFPVSWRTHNVVHDVLTVDFHAEWRLSTSEGSFESPEAVAGRGRKTAGTSFISLLEDSIVLRRVADDVTRVEIIRHSDTLNTGEAEDELYVRDFYESLRERAHGRDLPVWR